MTEDRNRLRSLPFPAFVVIGDVIPINFGRRRVTSFFYDDTVLGLDELSLHNHPGKSNESTHDASDHKTRLRLLNLKAGDAVSAGTVRRGRRELLNVQKALANLPFVRSYIDRLTDFHILVTPFPYSRAGQASTIRIYLSREQLDIETMIDLNLREARLESVSEFARYDGILHGYPQCCTEAFVQRRGSEIQATLRVLKKPNNRPPSHEGSLMKREDALYMLGESVYQFFSEEFYPCSLVTGEQCTEATNVGKEVFNCVKSVLPDIVAQDFFLTNRNIVMDPDGRSSYTTSQFSEVGSYHLPFIHFLRVLEHQGIK